MVSPYVEAAAKRAGILSANADHRPSDVRTARNQREAGIDWREWEDRTPALPRSWATLALAVAEGAALVAFFVAAFVASGGVEYLRNM